MEIITITIKYIKASLKTEEISFDLIDLILELTTNIAMKIKELKLELPIS
jgi:hypothetical protein